MRRWILVISLFIIGLLVATFLFPIIYKKKFETIFKTEINKRIQGRIDFEDFDISIIKSFPYLCFDLKNLKIYGPDSIQFISIKQTSLNLHLRKFLNSGFKIVELDGLVLNHPEILVKIDESGTANYSKIIRQNSTEPLANNVTARLSNIKIIQGNLFYTDSSSKIQISANSINHTSRIDLQMPLLDIDHNTQIDSFSFRMGGLNYLKNVKLKWSGHADLQSDSIHLYLKNNLILLNQLGFSLNANIISRNPNDGYDVNISLKTPENDVKQLISLIPGFYKHDFAHVRASGQFNMFLQVHGVLDSLHVPFITFDSELKDGMVKAPQLPYPIENMDFNLRVNSTDSFAKKIEIDIPKYSLTLHNEPLSGNLALRLNDHAYSVKGQSAGDIRLEDWQNAIPMDSMHMKGLIHIDVDFAFNDEQVRKNTFSDMKLQGLIRGHDIFIQNGSLPALQVPGLTSRLSPSICNFELSKSKIGKSDVEGNLSIDNPCALMTRQKFLSKININSKSDLLDLNEFTKSNPTTCDTCIQNDWSESVVPKLNLNFNSSAERLAYHDYIIQQVSFTGQYRQDSVTIKSLKLIIQKSPLSISGNLSNLYQWSSNVALLTGDLNVQTPEFLLEPWMTKDTSVKSGKTVSTQFVKHLPAHTELKLFLNAGEAIYGGMDLKNVIANVSLNHLELQINESKADLFGGKLTLHGVYQESGALPVFDMKTDMGNLSIAQFFNSHPSIAKLAPLAAFLDGKFSTSVVFQGKMDALMNVLYSDLDAAGVVETTNGIFSKFKPLEDAASKIQIPIANLLKWERSKNWFEIKQGTVTVNPFDIKAKEIKCTVSGTHQLDRSMNYDFLFSVPRSVYEKYVKNMETNIKLDWLKKQLDNRNIRLQQLDTLYILMNLSGTMANPNTTYQWVDSKKTALDQRIQKQLEDQLKAKSDSIKMQAENKVKATTDSILQVIKQQVETKKEQVDSIGNHIKDSLRKVAEQKTKEAIDSILQKQKGKIVDSTLRGRLDTIVGKKAKDEIDKINDKLKDWNPFKKKPKSN